MAGLHFNFLIPLKRGIAINILHIALFIGLKNLMHSPAIYGWAAEMAIMKCHLHKIITHYKQQGQILFKN